MNKKLKTFLLGAGIFGVIAAAVFVVYTVNKPSPVPVSLPSPKPPVVATPSPSPVQAQIFEVAANAACTTTFTIAEDLVPGLNCVSKELYKNVAANTAGHYTLTGNKLADDFTLIPGDTYIYALNYKNTGTAAVGGTFTDVLPAGLTYMDSTDGCTYATSTRTITCTVSSTAANTTGFAAVRFSVDTPATVTTITNSAKLTPTTGTASTCSLTNPVKTPPPSTTPSVSPSPSSSTTEGKLDCVVKRAYKDSTSNSAGRYYLNEEIVDTSSLTDGASVIYNVVIRNTGNASVGDTKITDVLSSNLTFVDGENGCVYDSASRTVTCTVGSLAASTETSRSFRVRIGVAGTTAIANTADVTASNGQRDSCSITINAAGKVVTPPSPVPSTLPEAGIFEVTAGTLGVGVILLILGSLGLLLL